MAEIIKNGAVVNDRWQIIAKTETAIPAGENLVLPYSLWQQQRSALAKRKDIAVWFDSDEQPDASLADALQQLPLVAINFPVFTDGRGFSIARVLRDRFSYCGELRAFGYVLRDQLCYMKRCGFTSFVLPPQANLREALASLDDFTEYYQTSVDQPQPLFRRA